ncbi:MAG: hypothetical protein F6K56_07345 [Moorea sp. SIO3G5]|nr:hypothetical protein [Moorena sp. SIO3G5]
MRCTPRIFRKFTFSPCLERFSALVVAHGGDPKEPKQKCQTPIKTIKGSWLPSPQGKPILFWNAYWIWNS